MNSNTDIHFCTECHNLTTLAIREEDQALIHHCKACERSEIFESSDRCIYTMTFQGRDMKHTLNQNKYLTHDITLPKIKGNPNLHCLNPDCASQGANETSSITYIKYDEDQMTYLYVCDACGQSWTNE
jgi:DNA-directed RNA polymerase subunit M/transcription elongation factor TFIIS